MSLTLLADRLAAVRSRVADACAAAGRPPHSVTLVAVSKGASADAVAAAAALGQRDFGENYLQEALAKIDGLRSAQPILPVSRMGQAQRGPSPAWHFLGPIQSNKTAEIALHFDWVHSVDRDKVARRLSEQRPPSLAPLNVCVQVNISGEATKSGIAPGQALALCRQVAALPRLRLRGLMAIPAPVAAGADARAPFRALRELFETLQHEGLALDTLSAGMSDDFTEAIAEGSTLVRIGTALFGRRD